MSFSDILALLEILVTILFGYYITHWVTVRDTRTRSVKDLYLTQLAEIKKNVDKFFDDLSSDRLKGRTIADWYGHQQNALTCFDDGLRLALPIHKRKLEEIVNDIHETITGSEFYNDNFNKKKYILTKDEQANMLELKNRVDKAFNEYVVQINNSRQYYFWETIKQNYRFDVEYLKDCGRKAAWLPALKIRCLKLLPYIVAMVALFLVIQGVYTSYEGNVAQEEERQNVLERSVDRLLEKADTLNMTLRNISDELDKTAEQDSCLLNILRQDVKVERRMIREMKLRDIEK